MGYLLVGVMFIRNDRFIDVIDDLFNVIETDFGNEDQMAYNPYGVCFQK